MMTSDLLLEFAAGATIGWLRLRGRVVALPLAVALVIGGFGLLFAIDAFIPLGGSRVLKYGTGAAMIVAGVLGMEASRRDGSRGQSCGTSATSPTRST